MADELKILALEGWSTIAETTENVKSYMAREGHWVWGVTAYLMTSFATGNILSAAYNIYLRSGMVA
jgi:hypothetical protein